MPQRGAGAASLLQASEQRQLPAFNGFKGFVAGVAAGFQKLILRVWYGFERVSEVIFQGFCMGFKGFQMLILRVWYGFQRVSEAFVIVLWCFVGFHGS